jgi:hypothetical protein
MVHLHGLRSGGSLPVPEPDQNVERPREQAE